MSLFSDDNYYKSDKEDESYIEFDFSEEYFFSEITLIFHENYQNCIPYLISLQILDNKKRMTNELVLSIKENSLQCNIIINEKARYIKCCFVGNYEGKYIIIKKMIFNSLEFGNFIE